MSRLGNRTRTGSISNIIGFAIDPDAAAFITASGLTATSQQLAIHQLAVDLKVANLWSRMHLIYPFIGGTAVTHSFNLKNPVLNKLIFVGGWTHTSLGAQPSGTNGYANARFPPSQLDSSLSNGMGYYSGTNLSETSADPINMGVSNNINTQVCLLGKGNSTIATRMNGAFLSASNSTMQGFISTHRTSSTVTTAYINTTPVLTGNSGGTLPISALWIGNIPLVTSPYTSGYVRNDFRFAYMSDGFSGSEITALYNIVQNYQTSLSRQV